MIGYTHLNAVSGAPSLVRLVQIALRYAEEITHSLRCAFDAHVKRSDPQEAVIFFWRNMKNSQKLDNIAMKRNERKLRV